MNLKKAKTLRKMLRANGVDPKERSYVQGKAGQRIVEDGIGADGTRKVKLVAITGTTSLVRGCGRSAYQEAKRLAA